MSHEGMTECDDIAFYFNKQVTGQIVSQNSFALTHLGSDELERQALAKHCGKLGG